MSDAQDNGLGVRTIRFHVRGGVLNASILWARAANGCVPELKMYAVAEFVTRANFGLTIGAFQLDLSDGQLVLSQALMYNELPEDEFVVYLTGLIAPLLATYDRYGAGIDKVVFQNGNPKLAVDACEAGLLKPSDGAKFAAGVARAFPIGKAGGGGGGGSAGAAAGGDVKVPSKHPHSLEATKNPYVSGGFVCNICRKEFKGALAFHCPSCPAPGYDECTDCHCTFAFALQSFAPSGHLVRLCVLTHARFDCSETESRHQSIGWKWRQ